VAEPDGGRRHVDVAMNLPRLHDGSRFAGKIVGDARLFSHGPAASDERSSRRLIVGMIDRTLPYGFKSVDTGLHDFRIIDHLVF
jgi:hypothetical protein